MKPYHSIETVFTRNKETNVLDFGTIRNSVNDFIPEWTISEKIDGTNIRVVVTLAGVSIKGRTDNANINPDLIKAVEAHFDHARLLAYFTEYRGKELPEAWSVTFYGEGYGAGIQKGGVYSATKKFRCFDLLLGESWWTSDSEMRRICEELGIPAVPLLGITMVIPQTRDELLSLFWEGDSIVARLDNGTTGVLPEGVVAKPLVPLFDTHGDRVMWKLTFREWDKQPRALAKAAPAVPQEAGE